MGEHPRRSHRRAEFRDRVSHVGDDALRFTRWYVGGKYALMASFLGELDDPPEARDARAVRERYCQAVSHGRRVTLARTVVTVLLAFGVVTTATASLANVMLVPDALQGDVATLRLMLQRVAAWSASAAVVLVVLRLAFDRYLDIVDTSATFLAMQLATTRNAAPER